jgi:Peptidase family M23
MATNAHISVRGARRRSVIVVALVTALAAVALDRTVTVSSASGRAEAAASYRWPVKPFDRPHPVRGNFGDPRTIFRSSPTLRGVLAGDCTCSFHRGIDISAPDGSPVYPVVSGTVTYADDEWVKVESGGGLAFEYWHIHPMVRVGSHVQAYQTVIGHIHRGSSHVHLTELNGGRYVNPLAPGHLGPYMDQTPPRVTAISLRREETGRDGLPNLVHGRVVLVAAAEDKPTLEAPHAWRDMPVAPALLSWQIRSWNGRAVIRQRVAVDLRNALPDRSFWQVYARGTYQNMAPLGRHYSWAQPGSYQFKLTPAAFDTRSLPDGTYDLVVTATDIRGNSGSLSRRFTIKNGRR